MSYSKTNKSAGGGADGSLLAFSDIELGYFENAGVIDIINDLRPFLQNHSVSAGDLVQFAGAVGLSNCQGAPRLEFLAGRPNAVFAAIDRLVPSPTDSADKLIERLDDAGFTAKELVALLASHSVARSSHVSEEAVHAPLDSTPGYFDSQYFLEVILKGDGYPGGGNGSAAEVESALASRGVIRLQSDFAVAHDSRTTCEWQSMISTSLPPFFPSLFNSYVLIILPPLYLYDVKTLCIC